MQAVPRADESVCRCTHPILEIITVSALYSKHCECDDCITSLFLSRITHAAGASTITDHLCDTSLILSATISYCSYTQTLVAYSKTTL